MESGQPYKNIVRLKIMMVLIKNVVKSDGNISGNARREFEAIK